ncbi:Lactate utilization protein C [Marinomonas spartinae]|uniref:Lactate utilization protein C n=1 Tax=Marinomonas spartinae TaxID=1792290 RepID=A0A1A8TRY5_9GAMM|nr:lactate utilization protein C [Marinomonas spartinae]SBS32942.1 Lactate utilization protein C [Marinomonas spartinae]SBS35725.1 Lactate utilization protein C [Marinomonas spartinae]
MTNQERLQHRTAFLDNIAKVLDRPRRTQAPVRPAFKYRCHQEVMAGWSPDQLRDHLVDYTKNALGAEAIVTTKAKLSQVLFEVCHAYQQNKSFNGGNDVVLSADVRLLADVDINQLTQAGLSSYVWDSSLGYDANIRVCERAKVGVVFAEQALAESGTMVLYSQAVQGRAISLLPEASVFVVPKSAIMPRLTQATALLSEKAKAGERMPSCINFISGPSSTADIELIKVVGVHGPIFATYIILDDQ